MPLDFSNKSTDMDFSGQAQPDFVSGASPDLSNLTAEQLNESMQNFAMEGMKKDVAKLVQESPVMATGASLAKGASFNFFDEIAQQASRLMGLPERQRGQMGDLVGEITAQNVVQRPVTAIGSEIVGNIAGALPAGMAAMGTKFGLMNPIKTAGLIGGAELGAALAGDAVFGESIPDRLKALGAGLAGGLPATMIGAKGTELLMNKALPAMMGGASNMFKSAEQQADDIIRPFLQDAFPTESAAMSKLRQLGDQATLMDVGEVPTQALAGAFASKDLAFKNVITKQLAKRSREGLRRINNSVMKVLGTKGKSVANTAKEISSKRMEEANPLYADAFSQKTTPEIMGSYLQTLDNQISQVENTSFAPALMKLKRSLFKTVTDADGSTSKVFKTDIKQLEHARNDLADKASAAWRSGDTQKWRMLKDARDGFDEFLMPDSYREANKIWSSSKSVDNAMDLGKKVLRDDVDGLTELMGSFNSSEREAYLIGATKAIKDQLGAKQLGRNVSATFNTPNVRDRLRVIIGDDVKFGQFMRDIDTENVFKATENFVLGNSATQAKQEAAKAFESQLIGDPSVSNIVKVLVKSVQNTKMPQPLRDELTKKLSTEGITPETLQAIMKTPLANSTIQKMLDFQPGAATALGLGTGGTQIIDGLIPNQ